jgi:purine-binding chemotaxis protein CheW
MAIGIDWQEAYTRLDRARQSLESGTEPPPAEVQRILGERAKVLARVLEQDPTPTEVLDLLVFSLGEERYGIELDHVLEVIPFRGLTPVPCTPPVVLGVANHRGQILPVMDLRQILELAGKGATNDGRIVAVQAGGMTFGIFAETVAGTVRMAAQEVSLPPAAIGGNRQAFNRGVTGDMLVVLDLEALARNSRLLVDEPVG